METKERRTIEFVGGVGMSEGVYPGAKNPSHEISLSDGVQTWGLCLVAGEKAIKETPLRPSTIRYQIQPNTKVVQSSLRTP